MTLRKCVIAQMRQSDNTPLCHRDNVALCELAAASMDEGAIEPSRQRVSTNTTAAPIGQCGTPLQRYRVNVPITLMGYRDKAPKKRSAEAPMRRRTEPPIRRNTNAQQHSRAKA